MLPIDPDADPGRRAWIDLELAQQIVQAQARHGCADADSDRAFRVMCAHRDHRMIEARIADSGHGEEELAGEKGRGLHSPQHNRHAARCHA